MNESEAQRIAAAVNALRPDWPVKSLVTFMGNRLANRPYRDVAIAFAWIALDPRTEIPTRILEDGPWWRAAALDEAGQPRSPRNPRPDEECPTHAGQFKHSCSGCAADRVASEEAARARVAAERRRVVEPDPTHPIAVSRAEYRMAMSQLCPHKVQTRYCAECRDQANERAKAQAEGRAPRPIQTVDLPETQPSEHGGMAAGTGEPPVGPTTRPQGSEQREGTRDAPASEGQLTRLHITLNELGLEDREEKLGYCQAVVDRPLSSTKELTGREAHRVIEMLNQIREETP